MNFFRSFLAAALGFSLIAACDDDDGPSIQSLCEKGCATEATLDCPNDVASTCVSDCVEGSSGVAEECSSEVTAALECVVNRPASDWECGEDGRAGPSEGVCEEEGAAAVECAFDGRCPYENDDECDDPTGTDLCEAGTDLADCA